MGYYSTIQDLPKIKKVEEFNKAVKEINEKADVNIPNWWVYWEDCKVDENNNLDFDDWTSKFYDAEEFVKWILQFEPSGKLTFRGEEGEFWGFEFAEGKVFELDFKVIETRMGELK